MVSKIAFYLSLTVMCLTLTTRANAAGNDGQKPPQDCAPLDKLKKAIEQAEKTDMLDGTRYSKIGGHQQNKIYDILSMHMVIEFDETDNYDHTIEKKTRPVCNYWRDNEKVALTALDANPINIYYISDNLKNNNVNVIIKAIEVGAKLNLDLNNDPDLKAALTTIQKSVNGVDAYKRILEISNRNNISDETMMALQLSVIKYSYIKNKHWEINELDLEDSEYTALFNQLSPEILLFIVKYHDVFFKLINKDQQTLLMAVAAYYNQGKNYVHIKEDLKSHESILNIKECHDISKWWFLKRGKCFDEVYDKLKQKDMASGI